MYKKKSLLPNDFRDFLSIISIIGFISIFFKFALNNPFLSQIQDALFLIIAGAGLLVVGKVFEIKDWLKDGLQKNEVTMLLALVFGLSAMIIGILLIIGMNIPVNLQGYIGLLALVPAIFILLDYLAKNS